MDSWLTLISFYHLKQISRCQIIHRDSVWFACKQLKVEDKVFFLYVTMSTAVSLERYPKNIE
jgi:hypothetical protein